MTERPPSPLFPSPGIPGQGRGEGGSPSSYISLPLLSWLLPQIAALFFSATRIPFSPRVPQPLELYAVQLMLVIQLTVATLLLPFLFRTPASALAVILTAPPLLLFAALLAGVPLPSTAWAALYITVYLAAIALAARGARIDLRHLQLLLTTLLLAGPLLLYLNSEFGTLSAQIARWTQWICPIPAALSLISGESRLPPLAFPPLAALAAHLVARLPRGSRA